MKKPLSFLISNFGKRCCSGSARVSIQVTTGSSPSQAIHTFCTLLIATYGASRCLLLTACCLGAYGLFVTSAYQCTPYFRL